MKASTLLFLVIILFTGLSCNRTITLSSITVETSIGKENISAGDSFELEIEVVDTDGIESVSIDVQSIGFSELFENISSTKWNFTKSFLINATATTGESEITVIVKDKNGEELLGFTPLRIE